MTAEPCAVFGLPAYDRPDALPRTLESLLGQTRGDLAVVVVDDAPTGAVRGIVESYARRDARVRYEPNPARLGMIGNWRRAFERSRAAHPGSRYFAWASDHDVWHPRWLEALTRALDGSPRAVLACPRTVRMYPHARRRTTAGFQTAGEPRRAARLKGALTAMAAGNAIYGLFRADALARAGVFRDVVLPDRQLLAELSLFGEFVEVEELLWYREASGRFTAGRQRETLFARRPPLATYLPMELQHGAVLAWDLGVRGRGRPEFGRAAGAWYALAQAWYSATRPRAPWRTWLAGARARGASGAGEAD